MNGHDMRKRVVWILGLALIVGVAIGLLRFANKSMGQTPRLPIEAATLKSIKPGMTKGQIDEMLGEVFYVPPHEKGQFWDAWWSNENEDRLIVVVLDSNDKVHSASFLPTQHVPIMPERFSDKVYRWLNLRWW
jgi:hypothetical protein